MRRLALVALLFPLLVSSAARADTLRLRDGRVLEGTLVSETRSQIVFDAIISNITTRMTFRRSQVESIEKGALTPPSTKVQKPQRADETPAPHTRVSARELYLVVPINGVFGEEVGPAGVADALAYAQRRGIKHVVFAIDSPGGQVWAADEISEVIGARDASITCYAVIDHAISAAIWVALSCDRIFIRSDGTIGGAVAYRQDVTTGAVEVDAKMNSIFAAKLAGICERNGYPPQIARAMARYEESLYAIDKGDAGYRFTDEHEPGAIKLDDEDTVLTLSAGQVERYGIGTIFDKDLGLLGQELGIDDWTLASDYGAAAMRRGQRSLRERTKLYDDRSELYFEFSLLVERINETAPENVRYNVHEGGAMTALAIRTWRQRTDTCIAACQELSRVIENLDRIASKARRAGIHDFIDREDVGEWRTNLDARIDQLRRNRNKSTF